MAFSLFDALKFPRKQKPPNSEADISSSAQGLETRHTDVRSPKQTKPPAYLFRYYQCQRATQRQKPDQCALNFRRARPDKPLNYPPRLRHTHRLMSRRVASAPPVKGYLRSAPRVRKRKKHPKSTFFRFFVFRVKTWAWRNFRAQTLPFAQFSTPTTLYLAHCPELYARNADQALVVVQDRANESRFIRLRSRMAITDA